jgi:hypothetical protein
LLAFLRAEETLSDSFRDDKTRHAAPGFRGS